MIIGWDNGHTIEGPNYGAVGYLKESEQTRVLGSKVIETLKDMGHTVINCTVDKAHNNNASLNNRVAKANAQKLDLFVSLHFNCSNGQGHGTEVFTHAAKELIQAKRVLDNICRLGFSNRGIKDGSNLAVIRGTKCPSMLIETCFVDNVIDVQLYRKNIDNITRAIAEGITGKQLINQIDKEDDDMIPSIKLAACMDSKIKDFMVGKIKELQGCVSLPQTGIATNELCLKLPVFKGGESKGSASILQEILQAKGYLSKDKILAIGESVENATNRLRKDNGLPVAETITDPLVWRKLIEY